MKKMYIIYQGPKFTIESYFDSRGKTTIFDYLDNLDLSRREKAISLFKTMGDAGKISNKQKFIFEGDQIYAFKPSPDRFLCFFTRGAKIIVTNAFEKKTDKIPPREKERALKYKNDYINRVNGGTYYD